MKHLFFLAVLLLALSCATDIAEVNAITQSNDVNTEYGSGISILYSDSAVIKVRITADSIVRHVDRNNPHDVFPSGIFVEFLSEQGRPTSWLEADYAVRSEKDGKFIVSRNVKFYNRNKETLLSTELTWEEDKSILYTDKFVTIVQPAKGDTTYGFGFESNEDFNIFEIKKRTSAIFRSTEFEDKFKD